MMKKNPTILRCKCSLKSLMGFDIPQELAKSMVNIPITREYGGDVIGHISDVDYKNDVVEMAIFSYVLPEVNIDNNNKATCFNTITLADQSFEIEPSFRSRFQN